MACSPFLVFALIGRNTVNTTKKGYFIINNYRMRLSILSRIMEIEEGVIGGHPAADNTLPDLHNTLHDTKDELDNCFIIHLK